MKKKIFVVLRTDLSEDVDDNTVCLIAFDNEAAAKAQVEEIYEKEKSKDTVVYYIDEIDLIEHEKN